MEFSDSDTEESNFSVLQDEETEKSLCASDGLCEVP